MSLQAASPRVLLASGSAARRALLAAAGLAFEVASAQVDEAALKQGAQADGLRPEDAALLLADAKATRAARRDPDALVIGGDQLLVCDGTWYDKPANLQQARSQLLALRGRSHVLVTAVLCCRGEHRLWQHVAKPRLSMRAFSDAFLDAYLALEGDRVTASVGAYRLEGPGMLLFDRIEGEHAAILGLPMLSLLAFLRQHGVLLA